MRDFGTYYAERVKEASKEQGIDELIEELKALGVEATSEQTGGFTMCAYLELSNNFYIYANPSGAGLYNEEGHEEDLFQYDEPNAKETAKGIANFVKGYLVASQI
jgi:hypothetical protein